MKQKIGFFLPVTLGMLTAFGPFITDFYLPSIPEMQGYFNTSPSLMAMSITAGMIGLAVGQIFIGPISDKYGRKNLLVASMALFAISSVLCVMAPNIFIFNLMRLLQGFAGAGGVVLAKSISTDMFSGKDLAKFMAILAAINGIAPVTAPIIGGSIANFASWQGVFILLIVLGLILMLCSLRLRETLPPCRRSQKNIWHVYANLFKVFRNRRFALASLASTASCFGLFAYIAASPYIFQDFYNLSPIAFSICFGINALMIGIGSALCALFKRQHFNLLFASANFLFGAVLVALCHIFNMPLLLLMACYSYLFISFGLLQPVATAIALDSERHNAGAASAVFGASAFFAGGLASPLVSMGDMLISTSLVILFSALACLALIIPLCRLLKRG